MSSNKILIAGYGVSGRGAARLASFLHADFDILDEKDTPELRAAADELPHKAENLFFGWNPATALPHYDMAVISPGIPQTSVLFQAAQQNASVVISELSFALRHINCPVIFVTGTNGKTTVTELTCALFNAAGMRTAAAGNIGAALSDSAIDSIQGKLDALIVEVSSFQLETMEPFTPDAAVLLNLASDHIDRHGSMEEYSRIKFTVFGELKNKCVINENLLPLKQQFISPETHFTTFSAYSGTSDFSLQNKMIFYKNEAVFLVDSMRLKGAHNIENAMASLALLRAIKGDEILRNHQVLDALKNFMPDAHRAELFLEHNGIKFINDSKATNPHAVNAALSAFGTEKNILIILGGLDKNMDFSELRIHAEKIKRAFLIGECKQKIFDALSHDFPCQLCETFQEACEQAVRDAVSGDIVMLSPAAASMDMFKNYRERGDIFKNTIRSLVEKN